MSNYLYVCVSISIYLFIYRSICLSINQSIKFCYLFLYLPILFYLFTPPFLLSSSLSLPPPSFLPFLRPLNLSFLSPLPISFLLPLPLRCLPPLPLSLPSSSPSLLSPFPSSHSPFSKPCVKKEITTPISTKSTNNSNMFDYTMTLTFPDAHVNSSLMGVFANRQEK